MCVPEKLPSEAVLQELKILCGGGGGGGVGGGLEVRNAVRREAAGPGFSTVFFSPDRKE